MAFTTMRAALPALLLGALICLSGAAAQDSSKMGQDTTGSAMKHAPGFTFGSNVAGYLRLSTDICDIKKAIGDSQTNPGYAEAKQIYLDGKNSYKSDGSIRTLRDVATGNYANEPIFDLYTAYYGTPAFLDKPVSSAFAGTAPYTTVPQRNQTIVKGLESNTQVVYMFHELDEAAEKIRDKKLGAKDGAPHNIDETWAIYVGERPDCSLWGVSQKRAMEFGTMQDCETSKVNAGVLNTHRAMYDAAQRGDLPAFLKQQNETIRLVTITYIQAMLKYAQLMDEARAKNDQAAMEDEQTEAYMFFRTVEPLIARASNSSAATLNQLFTPGNPIRPNTLQTAKAALEATYSKLGISADDIGSYGAKQALGCAPPPASSGASAVARGAGALLLAALAAALL